MTKWELLNFFKDTNETSVIGKLTVNFGLLGEISDLTTFSGPVDSLWGLGFL